MLPISLNPLPILVTLTAAFSVFVHDSQLDYAAISAIAVVPAAIMTTDIMNLGANQHVHAERGSFARTARSNQAATPPRNEDEKKYIAQRRLLGDSFGSEYYWPSI
jgi:hypothetical protein